MVKHIFKTIVISLFLLVSCGSTESSNFMPLKTDIDYHQFEPDPLNERIDSTEFARLYKENYQKDIVYQNIKVSITSKNGFHQSLGDVADVLHFMDDNRVSFFSNVINESTGWKKKGLFGRCIGIDFSFIEGDYCKPVSMFLKSSEYIGKILLNEVVDQDIRYYNHKLLFKFNSTPAEYIDYVKYDFSNDYHIASMTIGTADDLYTLSFSYFNEEDTANYGDNVSCELFLASIYARANKNISIKSVFAKCNFDYLGTYRPAKWTEPTASFEPNLHEGVYTQFKYVSEYGVYDKPIANYIVSDIKPALDSDYLIDDMGKQKLMMGVLLCWDDIGRNQPQKMFGFGYYEDLTGYNNGYSIFGRWSLELSLTTMTAHWMDGNNKEVIVLFNDIGLIKGMKTVGEIVVPTSFQSFKNIDINIEYSTE